MPSRKQNKTGQIERWALVGLIVGGILFVILAMALSIQNGKDTLRTNAGEQLDQMKSICRKYENYRLAVMTKDLQALISKAGMLNWYSADVDLKDETALGKYAKDQYLSGLMVLDENLELVSSTANDREAQSELLALIRSEEQAAQILNFQQMTYANQVKIGENTYEYAIVAWKTEPGLIISYKDTTALQKDKYELSLQSMLDIDTLEKQATIVVTDGTEVLYSSEPSLEGMQVSDCPITNAVAGDANKSDTTLIELHADSETWYGRHDSYRNYYLYVFYHGSRVYSGLIRQLLVSIGVYLVLALTAALLIQVRRKEKLLTMQKEYSLIQAIGSMYDVNLLIDLEKNTWEPILETPRTREALAGIERADDMLFICREQLVAEEDRSEFARFVNLKTISDRLYGRHFIGQSFQSVSGKWYQALLVPQRRNEKERTLAVMLLIRNITEQKEKELDYQDQLRRTAERADFANAVKTDFLRRMSHDIRTPINGIRGMAEVGLDRVEDAEHVKDCLTKIHNASDYLLELVNNVLDMSKLEAGEVVIEKDPFDLREVLQSTWTVIEAQAAESDVLLQCDEPQGEHWNLIGSPLNIQRIFQNLMSNAVKYNRRGGFVQVSCRETSYENGIATFLFVCADTGIGMSKEFQEHAFETFAQEQKTARTTYSGSGLGLSIAKKTVDLLGGTIGFVSREGKGTVFTVSLPLKVDLEAEQRKAKKQQEAQPGSIAGVKVLMAEDNELNLEIATYMLEEKGAVVTQARDGKEAADKFAASAPGAFDVILMDIMMPVMDGLEATRTIRAMEREDAKTIPIFAVTANAFSDDIAASRASGMNEHLSKPLKFEELNAMICKYVKR